MDFQAVLQSIKPGITLYGVLLTFAVTSLIIAKFFWNYEKQLMEENIEKLRNLMNSFRDRYVNPILRNELTEAVHSGYGSAIKDLKAELYPKVATATGFERKLIEEAKLNSLIDYESLEKRVDNFKAAHIDKEDIYLSSDTGEDLLDNLDRSYDQKNNLSVSYESACSACAKTSYSFLILSALLFLGILQVIGDWPKFLLFLWIVVTAQIFIFGIYSFCRLEYCRRKLIKLWKELQLYGKI
ncbi:hypothetical protein ES703_98691 [subsurface metagenome]